MSLRSVVGTIGNGVVNNFQNDVHSALNDIKTLFNGTVTAFSHIWDGGFAGIDAAHFDDLKLAITKYCENVQAIVAGFDENANVQQAYKGIDEQIAEYVRDVKSLVNAYVTTIKNDIKEADTAFQNYQAAAKSLASDISSDAQTIRSKANDIRVD